MNRNEILTKATEVINGDRQESYGDAKRSFGTIAGLWSNYLGMLITPIDVANMMVLLKVSRIATGGSSNNEDSFVDICGYAALAGELAFEMKSMDIRNEEENDDK